MCEAVKCKVCDVVMDKSPEHKSYDGVCLTCIANSGNIEFDKRLSFINGFKAACKILRDDSVNDFYGIGSMCSQWTAEDVADDLESYLLGLL